MKLRFWIGIILIAFAAGLFAYRGRIAGYVVEKWEQRKLPEAMTYEEVAEARPDTAVSPQDDGAFVPHPNPLPRGEGELSMLPRLQGETELPVEFNIAVPFTSQAPFEVWDEVHKEACEEAAVMMVDAFFSGRAFTRENAEEEIQNLVVWQNQVFGYFKDTTAEETARILREKYGYGSVRVVYDPTIDDVKYEVAQGHPVILPAAGRLLGNRYFRQPGPLYHMLLVRGWTKDGMIITNDPGTKRGEAYLYNPDVLMNAVHDWNGGEVENGRKVMIIVGK